ncbi:MAG: Holliday junction branch migration protein RuvA [Myxococcales bacterium]|nr:MAG: Holliday junction branch migration protein RuvA [Myxococcales bacterium]
MIGRLNGVIEERADDGCCLIDVNGVGYEVFVPLGALGRLPDQNKKTTLYIHTHVREDALTLYGFDSSENREAFRILLSVSGVGPRVAMAILGKMQSSDLAAAVHRTDPAPFKGIPGVGKKTVDRLLLELRDKLIHLLNPSAGSVAQSNTINGKQDDPLRQLAEALMHMGYKRTQAVQAVSAIAPSADGKAMETLLREALATLA